ncbi:MAG: OmpH family outer membrane protein [Muribaculaceae bacterium]|nr:OmpH family outer membrane protein [Muribaculaceae bacterium]
MKNISKQAICLILAIIGIFMATSAQEVVVPNSLSPSINIRYIDMELIMSKYTKAIEYQEWALLASDSAKNVLTAEYTAVKDFETRCAKKLQNKQYQSDQAVRNDQNKLQKMAEEVRALEQRLTQEFNTENARRMQLLQESIMNYIADYNAIYKYDAILYKSAGILFNPTLDITNIIIEGLNKKDNKPKEVILPIPNGALVPQKAEDNTITP